MKSLSLLVVGSVALDRVDGPFGCRDRILGGSASFCSLAASYLAGPGAARLVAVVGDDFPEEHVRFLEAHGVDARGLERAPGRTFFWSGRYADDLATRATLDTQLGVFASFRPKLADFHRDSDLVFLGNIDPDLQREVVGQVRRPRLVACDTMNFWISGKPESLEKTLRCVDLLLLNDEEARQLSGQYSLVDAAAAIRKRGPKSVVVKRGDAGALLFDEVGPFFAPALPLPTVKDPTGAGDTFAGGFMGHLARVGDTGPRALRQAMIMGSVMASFAVEDFSLDRLRDLAPADIGARCRAFHDLVTFDEIQM